MYNRIGQVIRVDLEEASVCFESGSTSLLVGLGWLAIGSLPNEATGLGESEPLRILTEVFAALVGSHGVHFRNVHTGKFSLDLV